MSRPTAFGAVCEHGRLARKCERCADADEIASLRDCAKQYEQWLAQDHATIADLRDRLRIMARVACEGCGCAPSYDVSREYCLDCWEVGRNYHGINGSGSHVSSSLSVGLRALCGRRLLDGGEVK